MAGKIYTVIAEVAGEVGAVAKTAKNASQGFAYRGIDSVMNALSPVLAKHHLIILPEVLKIEREDRQTARGGNLVHSIVTVQYTFVADDGSNVSAIVIGEGMDSGDKSASKAMSIAFKYACFQVFCIPTEEMVDPDKDSYEVRPKKYTKAYIEEHGKDKISAEELEKLRTACASAGEKMSLEKAVAACGCEHPEEINVVQYVALMRQLKQAA